MKKVLVFTNANQMRKADKLIGMFRVAKAAAWQLFYLEPEAPATEVRKLCRSLKPDGIIIEGDHANEALAKLPDTKVPRVFLDANIPHPGRYHTVESDAAIIAQRAFDELAPAADSQAIFVSVQSDLPWSQARRASFAKSCEHGQVALSFIETTDSNPILSGDQIAAALRRLDPPIAAFAVNDLAASALYAAARKCGLRIPHELKVVSVDNNLTICENLNPTLTSIEQDMEQAGEAAAQTLAMLMEHRPSVRRHTYIPPRTLIRRNSSLTLLGAAAVNRALTLIRERADSRLRISEVAEAMGKARRTAEKLFLEVTGKSIGAAILDARFEKVLELLSRPNQKLSAIANLCGWRSSTQLMRSFKSRYGVTMSEYKIRSSPARVFSSSLSKLDRH